jgi:capsule polysaccharide export protein KpsE/RkpR
MGFAASQARLMMLTARVSDLELQGQFINQARLQLANTVGSLFTITANLEPESPTAQALQARVAAIQAIDKALDLQLKRLDSQREAIQTELDAVKKVVTKNIQTSFKTFG